jgi:3-methyladenine DNA glycosylase/8-oxoguanine DNA glycosylase
MATRARNHTHTVDLPVAPPFDLRLCLHGHGWVALAPHRYDEAAGTLATVLTLGDDAVDATLHQENTTTLQLRLVAARALRAADGKRAAQQIAHMLRLHDDLSTFHAVCAQEPRLQWAARRGAGRLMRSATVFEDLMKLLFTTNTTWAGTEAMTRNLVAAVGPLAPSGARAFPSPKQCVQPPAFYRDIVRTGYRADAAVRLASAFTSGELDDTTFLAPQPAEQLWRRLLALHGFGPYAAGQAMRLCGHYEKLALDSWCRARLKAIDGKTKAPTDRAVERRYARFAPFQGLAMWLDLTAEWHGEGTSPAPSRE